MNNSKHNGSCLCGEVTFEIDGGFDHFFLCHCSRCRQSSGTAHGANLFSKTAKLKFIKGEDKIKDYLVPNTRFVATFCIECGGKLPKDHNGKMLQVPAGSLSSDVEIRPTAHIFCASSANWDDSLDSVDRFDGHWGN